MYLKLDSCVVSARSATVRGWWTSSTVEAPLYSTRNITCLRRRYVTYGYDTSSWPTMTLVICHRLQYSRTIHWITHMAAKGSRSIRLVRRTLFKSIPKTASTWSNRFAELVRLTCSPNLFAELVRQTHQQARQTRNRSCSRKSYLLDRHVYRRSSSRMFDRRRSSETV